MKVLVIGGTGTVGGEVVRGLLERGADVRILSREPADSAGVEWAAGDLGSPESLTPAFDGIGAVFLLTPLAPNEAQLGLAAVDAAAAAGVERLVLNSVFQSARASHVPNMRSKTEIVEGLVASGLPHTILEPAMFCQNDVWLRAPLTEHGIYPTPIGHVGTNRVDVRDIAAAAVRALLEPGFEGRTFPIVGPTSPTGEECAAVWSRALGREVRYMGDLDAWAEGARQVLPEWLVDDLRVMYGHFMQNGLLAGDEDHAATAEILGGRPRSYDEFVVELAASWAS